MTMTVDEIMTEQVVTLNEQASLRDAIELMKHHQIRHVPVISDAGLLIGLVSQRDLLAAQDSTLESLNATQREERERSTPVTGLMTTRLATIAPTTGIKQAALLLEHHKFGCLPVVDKRERLVGMVTGSDFVAVAINLLETLEAIEPDEIDE